MNVLTATSDWGILPPQGKYEPCILQGSCAGFDGGSKANVGHYKMHSRNHFVVKNGLQWKIMIPY